MNIFEGETMLMGGDFQEALVVQGVVFALGIHQTDDQGDVEGRFFGLRVVLAHWEDLLDLEDEFLLGFHGTLC
jgi:hypothetical protein